MDTLLTVSILGFHVYALAFAVVLYRLASRRDEKNLH